MPTATDVDDESAAPPYAPSAPCAFLSGVVLLIPLLLACTFKDSSYEAEAVWDVTGWMPLDGDRRAEYVNENLDWSLIVEKTMTTSGEDGVDIVTMEWTRGDTGEVLGSVLWSSAHDEGVYIHGYSVGAEAPTTFDTPVAFTDEDGVMQPGDSVQTTTNGYTFTSTFIRTADCPTAWTEDWSGCPHFRLDDGDDDDLSGPIFAGDYWLEEPYGPAWMLLTGYTEIWNLADYEWSGDDDWPE